EEGGLLHEMDGFHPEASPTRHKRTPEAISTESHLLCCVYRRPFLFRCIRLRIFSPLEGASPRTSCGNKLGISRRELSSGVCVRSSKCRAKSGIGFVGRATGA